MASGAGAWSLPRVYSLGDPEKSTAVEHHRQRIRWAVIAIQRDLIRQGRLDADIDTLTGGFGPLTAQAVRDFQGLHGLRMDGQVGPKTAAVLFRDWPRFFEWYYGVPDRILHGIIAHESAWDPGAEGYVNADDRGLMQWNRIHVDVTDEIAYSRPDLSVQKAGIEWAAAFLRHSHEPYGSKFTATAAHNNPRDALAWARTNHVPDGLRAYVSSVFEKAKAAAS